MPDDFSFLCALHNLGATSMDRSLTFEEIRKWTAMEPERVRLNIQKNVEANYIQVDPSSGAERFYLTANGIRKVLSMYS